MSFFCRYLFGCRISRIEHINFRIIKAILFVTLFFSIFLNAYSREFEFRFEPGRRYRIVSEVTESVFLNDEPFAAAMIRNKIAVESLCVQDKVEQLNVTYQIAEEREESGGLYHWADEGIAKFGRDSSGTLYGLKQESLFPAVKNIPFFPEGEIEPGSSWYSPASEVYDLNPVFGLEYILTLEFNAFYTYEGISVVNGKNYDRIDIEYHYVKDLPALDMMANHPEWDSFPEKVKGSFKQILLWDAEKGLPFSVSESFDMYFYFPRNLDFRFTGKGEGFLIVSEDWNKKAEAEKIEEELVETGIEDVSVEIDDTGIHVNLENIEFLPDSSLLTDDEKLKILRIGEILKSYPDRDLLLEGHTARVGTPESCLILSNERAAAVASWLIEQGIATQDRLVIKGRGAEEPIADNSSEEGRKRNRRVEIIILDN